MAGIISDILKLGGVPQSASKHVAMSTCFDIWIPDVETGPIGFLSSVSINHTRTVTQIRHLNSVDAGIPVDIVVTPDVVTLSFNGFYVYSDSGSKQLSTDAAGNLSVGPSMGRLSGVSLLRTLDQQQIPFDLVVSHAFRSTLTPSAGFKDGEDGVTIIAVYRNCTIASMTIPINLGTAAVSDSGNISVGYVASGY